MIIHSISPYSDGEKKKEKSGGLKGVVLGSKTHRQGILERALSQCKFAEGEYVWYKRSKGLIDGIFDEYDDVVWDGLKPLFIMVNSDGESHMVHHSDIKRMR